MNVVIRVDATLSIGTGHVMRCMALASELKQRGSNVFFISREDPGNLCVFLENEGFVVYRILHDITEIMKINNTLDYNHWFETLQVKDAIETGNIINVSNLQVDWLVVDHYALDHTWERLMRPFTKHIMVIDDLANRNHDCDLLLDQNLYRDMEKQYDRYTLPNTVKLLGPKFALLRKEFLEQRRIISERNGEIKSILIFFGGVDKFNLTMKTIEAITFINTKKFELDIVIGINNPHRKTIEEIAAKLPNTKCYFNSREISKLMSKADIFIGTAGITTWERCCLGLPSIVITVADNQIKTMQYLHEKKIVYYVGKNVDFSAKDIIEALELFCCEPELVRQYSKHSMSLVDGKGVQRCVDRMLSFAG